MFNKKLKRAICVMSSTVLMGAQIVTPTAFAGVKSDVGTTTYKATTITTSDLKSTNDDTYAQRFAELYNIVKGSDSKYFNDQGIPYHSIETLMVEAPDQGHESTSEAASYYGWLEAMRGELTGDYSTISDVWDCIENYYIPTAADQPGQDTYNPSSPATYAAEYDDPSKYPSVLGFDTAVGSDPLYYELKNTYGSSNIYGMHWLIDVDNFYGYGQRSDGTSTPAYINTYQRGKQESVFETIPQPCWETFKWGGSNGYLDLFTGDNSYSQQWKYTNAPDADARLVQAMYGAAEYAKADGVDLSTYVDDASEMGDYLRYSMFDKYFMKIGAQSKTAGTGRDSEHYLLSWYYAWGGGIGANWSWRIGCSHSHFGYQNPMAAYVLSNDSDFIPASTTAQSDWSNSLQRQIEMYTWLQSDEGAIAGGCTNSWDGAYETYPTGTSTFYGMAYTPHPVYEDPGSNRWFGMQAWSMQRMCEYYYTTGDEQVKSLVDKWAKWAAGEITLNADGTFLIPSNLTWEGQPETWTSSDSTSTWQGSSDLHCTVSSYGEDVGIAGSLSNALLYYVAAVDKYDNANYDEDTYAIGKKAQGLLDSLYSNYTDEDGVASKGLWDSTARFFEQEVYVPSGWTGTMPNGDVIESGDKFIDIRTNYEDDADYQALLNAYQNGEDYETNYHRFWAQVEVAVANGVMSQLFNGEIPNPAGVSCDLIAPADGATIDCTSGAKTVTLDAEASTKASDASISEIAYYVDDVKVGTGDTFAWTPAETNVDTDGYQSYTIKAVATDTTGQTASSSAITVKVKWEASVSPSPSSEAPSSEAPSSETPSSEAPSSEAPSSETPSSEAPTGTNITVTCPTGATTTNTIGGQFQVTNSGTAVSLKDITIRYYFTADSSSSINAYVDNIGLSLSEAPWYAALTSSTTAKVVTMTNPTSTADSYLEITFSADYDLSSTGNLQMGIRLAKNDWSNFTQSNDYSYTNGAVVLVNGSVVSGSIPS